MNKILKLIRQEVRNIFENEEKYFNGMRVIADVTEGDEPVWDPLYEFLKHIFHEDNKKAADGFMFYGIYETPFDLIIYIYKNGITRKSIALDGNGNPYELVFSWDSQKRDNYLSEVKKLTMEETFKDLYGNMIKTISKACEYSNCVIPNDSYFMSYSDYKVLRDQMLKKAGFKVNTVSGKEGFEKLEEIKLDEKWSKKYKRNIDCSNPKGFSQKAHCAARKKRQKGEETKSKSPFAND